MHNKIPVPYSSMLPISLNNHLLPAAKQEPYQKAYFLMKTLKNFVGKKPGEWATGRKNDEMEEQKE